MEGFYDVVKSKNLWWKNTPWKLLSLIISRDCGGWPENPRFCHTSSITGHFNDSSKKGMSETAGLLKTVETTNFGMLRNSKMFNEDKHPSEIQKCLILDTERFWISKGCLRMEHTSLWVRHFHFWLLYGTIVRPVISGV